MALSQAILLRLARLGGSKVATRQADGTAQQVHPFAEDWYIAAQKDEDQATWMAVAGLWEEAIAAKTAALCLVNPWNDDAMARGVIDSEPGAGAEGSRSYANEIRDEFEWKATAPGRRYNQLRNRLSGSGPILAL